MQLTPDALTKSRNTSLPASFQGVNALIERTDFCVGGLGSRSTGDVTFSCVPRVPGHEAADPAEFDPHAPSLILIIRNHTGDVGTRRREFKIGDTNEREVS